MAVIEIPMEIVFHPTVIKIYPEIPLFHATFGGIPIPVLPDHFALCAEVVNTIIDSKNATLEDLAKDFRSRLYRESQSKRIEVMTEILLTKDNPKGGATPTIKPAQLRNYLRTSDDIEDLERLVGKFGKTQQELSENVNTFQKSIDDLAKSANDSKNISDNVQEIKTHMQSLEVQLNNGSYREWTYLSLHTAPLTSQDRRSSPSPEPTVANRHVASGSSSRPSMYTGLNLSQTLTFAHSIIFGTCRNFSQTLTFAHREDYGIPLTAYCELVVAVSDQTNNKRHSCIYAVHEQCINEDGLFAHPGQPYGNECCCCDVMLAV